MICRRCGRVVNESSADGLCFRCTRRIVDARKRQTFERRSGVMNRFISGGIT